MLDVSFEQNKKPQTGFSHHLLLLIALFAGIVLAGAHVYKTQKANNIDTKLGANVLDLNKAYQTVDDEEDGSINDDWGDGPNIEVNRAYRVAGVRYNTPPQTGKELEGRMFHQKPRLRQTYAFENSPRGIEYAYKHKYTSIDLDMHISKDGVPVITHWHRPLLKDGFYDPQRKIAKNAQISSLTYAEIRRLRNRDRKSQIYSLEYMCKLLKKRKLNLSLEIKSPRATYEQLDKITTILNNNGIKAYVKANARYKSMDIMLGEARDTGYWTRGTLGSQSWQSPTAQN